MTREERKKYYTTIDGLKDAMYLPNIIDQIYDDIESRVCGNCEFYINNEYHIGCSRLKTNFNQPTFGCNEFVHKLESK